MEPNSSNYCEQQTTAAAETPTACASLFARTYHQFTTKLIAMMFHNHTAASNLICSPLVPLRVRSAFVDQLFALEHPTLSETIVDDGGVATATAGGGGGE